MKTTIRVLTAAALLSSGSALAQQATAEAQQATAETADTPAPSTAAPSQMPPAPPSNPGQPPGVASAASPAPQVIAPSTSNGQWTYTRQYGWVYLPYSQSYTYVTPDGGIAYEYAYYPASGWGWVEAPWVLGFGPRPFWGYHGYGHFAWYAHPWFHAGVYRGAYGYRGGYGHVHAAAPAYGRHGFHGHGRR
jgi:hypothetical protein